ncbi:MAG: tetratricopeptide repeat protein [Nitrospina sp.]|nr:MAG: tetratricopeptide repeat protein [Nitrospina sp.]
MATAANLVIGIGCIRIHQEDHPGEKTSFRLPRLSWPKMDWSFDQKIWMGLSFVCGFTALAYEVLWTRLLVFSIASTVYSFSMMLGVFLLGICLGSLLVVPVMARVANLRVVLIALQVGICAYVVFSLFAMGSLLSPPWNSYNLQNPWNVFLHYFQDSAALMGVPTLLMGMNIPILIKLVTEGPEHIGRGTGRIYSANTLGAIAGSLMAGFVFLPQWGVEKSLLVVATLNLMMAPLLFWTGKSPAPKVRYALAGGLAGLTVVLHLLMPVNLLDRFFMRDSAGQRDLRQLLYFEEGLTDTVAVFTDNYGILDPSAKRLITNGISMSASNVIASRYMKLFAHVPILLVDHPEDVLVICFGTGQTTGAAGLHPRVRSVDSLELSASVIHAAAIFKEENHDVINNPKVHITLEDGRNFLLTTQKKFDVITGEPPPPRTAFTVNLYTQDFYELARAKLKPGGIMAQWVPLHSQSAREVDMHFKTFLAVFPHAIAWMSVANEILLIGSDRPIELGFEKLKKRLAEPEVRAALDAIQIPDVYSFLSNIWFFEEEMNQLAAGQPLITDNHPRIEFYLDFGGVIGTPGLERLVFNRTPADQIWRRIKNMEYSDWKRFEKQYQVMDLYQRGVMYGNRELLVKALRLGGDNDLIRYHLQAGHGLVRRLQAKLDHNPEDVEALLNLGHALYQVGDYASSMDYLNRVLAIDPNETFAHLYLGYDLMGLERWAEAKAVLRSVMKKDPRQLRSVMQEVGLIELLEKLQASPDNIGLLNAVAQFYNVKNEFGKSLEFTTRVLEKDPLSKQALQSAVFSHRGLGEPDQVIGFGVRYDLVDPEDIHFQYIMAEMYIQTLRCEKAVPYLKRILKKDDTYRNAQQLIDRCRRKSSSANT